MKEVTVGVDIGGTNTQYGFVDREGNCLFDDTMPTQVYESVEQYVEALHNNVLKALEKIPEDIQIQGIGFGAPNGNYYRGTVEYAPNLRWKGILKILDIYKKFLNVPMALTNDANAAALGEMMYGGAKGMKDFIVITLGTGLGSGIVVNGEMVYGNDGFAGEIGHTIVDYDGRQCGCGRRGCLETYASATGIKRTVYELMAEMNEPSDLRTVPFNDMTAKMIADAAHNGDPIAKEAFEKTGKILGLKLADSVVHTSPEAIFLFGGLALAGDLIFEPTQRYMEDIMLNIFKNKVKLLPSGLNGKNAAIYGAAALAWKELDKLPV